MKIDTKRSIYCERGDVAQRFDRTELRRLRTILRRLHFLEAQVAQRGGLSNGGTTGGGAVFVEAELEALEWILDDIEFLETRERKARQ